MLADDHKAKVQARADEYEKDPSLVRRILEQSAAAALSGELQDTLAAAREKWPDDHPEVRALDAMVP